ncbi:hypothetical protein NQ318_004523, partial [Aromia moschata]
LRQIDVIFDDSTFSRLVIRTSELQTLRGAVLEDAIPNIKASSNAKTLNTKEVLEYVAPEVQLSSLRLGVQNQQTVEQILKLDEQGLTNHYKVGIMYCRAGQNSEEEMYNNEEAGPAFTEFLETIGKKVRLNGFDKYKAGLDNKTIDDSHKCKRRFHLPNKPFFRNFNPLKNILEGVKKRRRWDTKEDFKERNDSRWAEKGSSILGEAFKVTPRIKTCLQPLCAVNFHGSVLEMEYHIWCSIGHSRIPKIKNPDSTGLYSIYAQYQDCEIMFHVSTMLPFTPNNRQQLLRKRHIGNDIVTIVFQEPGALPLHPQRHQNTHYKVAVSRSKDVEVFGPPIKEGAVFPKGKVFAEFLLAKVVNAENAAHRSEKFVTMATRTRQEYLKDLVMNYSTSTPVDTGQKFSIFSSKKKDKIRPRFIPDLCQRGAILWQVLLDDSGQGQQIECFLGVSSDSFVLIEEHSKQIVRTASGSTTTKGECMTIHMRDIHGDRDELMEIMDRLKAVTFGHIAQEFSISRNIMGQLGFHVQPDGIVTLVESAGQAWQAGLRQNSRLVEICKVAVATLTYDQMVDLLKTSLTVILTVIPPLPDGPPRKGCTLQNCKYNEAHYEGDYENAGNDENKGRRAPQMQQAVSGHHRRIYERSFCATQEQQQFWLRDRQQQQVVSRTGVQVSDKRGEKLQGTLTSSSSGHSSDDKWYDILQELDPPPIPVKSSQHGPRGHHSNNTFPSTPKRNNSHQMTQMQTSSHNHYTIQHNKIQVSNSLPLQHVNVSQPLSAALHANTNDLDFYKMEKNNIIKQQNERLRQENDYVVTRAPRVADYSTIQHGVNNDFSRLNLNDGHSTDSSVSDRNNMCGSEDELSNGSGNMSPRSRRAKHMTVTQSGSYSSRNQSPRSVNGEAKLRPGVTQRSSNRNSANLSSTNFQEELLRLINPDSIEAAPDQKLNKDIKTHSRENLNNALSVHKTQPEVILTMARPATVISNASTTSSPLPNEFKRSQDDILSHIASPNKGKSGLNFPDNFPLPEDSDWPSLVDAATRVVMQVGSASEVNSEQEVGRHWNDDVVPIDASITSSVSSSTSVPELQSHVAELESKVNRETRRRMSLEHEVRRLTEENRKLQDQAQAAVQQLRKFTEWFFKNVKRQ